MILAHEKSRQPGEDHVRPGEAHDPHYLLQACAVMPVAKRLQNVLAGSVAAIQKPDVLDPKLSQGMA